jgi:3',5'-cyclic AMP phosphodiesterase CpdA
VTFLSKKPVCHKPIFVLLVLKLDFVSLSILIITDMKAGLLTFFLFILFTGSTSIGIAQVGLQDIKICVISDVHYFDTSLLINDGAAFEEYLMYDRKLLRESYAITASLFDSLAAEHPDILLVSGDITKDGELVCHQTMADYFNQLEAAGTQVFVCPGNHDINNPMAVAFDGDVTYPVPGLSPEEFKTIYGNFGFDEAIAVDTASLSYVVEPIEGLQILSMDVCRYDSNYFDNYPQTNGGFEPNVLQWVKDRIIDATGQGKIIIGLMHHNVVQHFTNQKLIFDEYVIDDWDNVSTQFADLGMKAVFTGHFHAQDIVRKTAPSGKQIFDIETGSVVTWPCPYRICHLQTNLSLVITGKKVEEIDYDTGSLTFQEYALNDLETGMPPTIIYLLTNPPYNISESMAETVEPAFTETLIAHYNGNEGNPSANTQWIMFLLNISGYSYITVALQSVWNDLAPDDWNTSMSLTPAGTQLVIDLTVFLEGPYNGSFMDAGLNPDYLPLAQPYSGLPWGYTGSHEVTGIPNPDIADWVLVEIRDAASAALATSVTTAGRQSAWILKDGSIIDADGVSALTFYHTPVHQMFVVVYHRNHLAVMSANPLVLSGGVYPYNFTTGAGQFYGNSAGAKDLGSGIWGMISGDADADGTVTTTDKNDNWMLQAGSAGYLESDFDLNGNSDNADKNEKWHPNLDRASQVPQ